MNIILKDVSETVSNLFNISPDEIKNNEESFLFSKPFQLKPTELLYLYFYLEEKYGIRFNEKDVYNFSFISISGIANNISNHITN